jgi:hypothetical protein
MMKSVLMGIKERQPPSSMEIRTLMFPPHHRPRAPGSPPGKRCRIAPCASRCPASPVVLVGRRRSAVAVCVPHDSGCRAPLLCPCAIKVAARSRAWRSTAITRRVGSGLTAHTAFRACGLPARKGGSADQTLRRSGNVNPTASGGAPELAIRSPFSPILCNSEHRDRGEQPNQKRPVVCAV